MKQIVTLLMLTLLLPEAALNASAATQLSLGSTTLQPGQTASLNLTLTGGTEPYAGLNARILLPAGVSVTSISKGTLLPASFTTDWQPFTSAEGSGATIIAYTTDKTPFTATNGILLTLNLKAANEATPGTHEVSFATSNIDPLVNSKYALSNADGTISVPLTTSPGTITISSLPGDADNDGLPDWWEQQIINADPYDEITSIEDVQPGDDFDGDGVDNFTEYSTDCYPAIPDVCYIKGDVNKDGKLTPQDAVDVFQLSLKASWTTEELNLADYNDDGQITPQDAVDIFWASF